MLQVKVCSMAKFIATLSVIPIGTKSTSLSKYVAKVIEKLKKAGINLEVTPMNTVIYSDNLEDILKAVEIAHDALREEGVERMDLFLKIDARHDKPGRKPIDKVKAVLEKLT